MRDDGLDEARDTMRDALARLRSAADRAGLVVPAPPETPPGDAVAAIARAVHPLRLPAELELLWQAIDPETLPLQVDPEVLPPAAALGGWQMFRAVAPGQVSPVLLPIAYEDHGFLLIELHDARRLGGSIFHWSCGGAPFTLRHRRLTDYVLQMAGRVERRAFDPSGPGGLGDRGPGRAERRRPRVAEATWALEARAQLASAPRHPLHDADAAYEDDDPSSWPAHWLRWFVDDDVSVSDLLPRGATATLTSFLAASARSGSGPLGGEPRARVVVQVLASTRIGDLWYVDLSDSESQVVGVLEARRSAHGPRAGDQYEMDLVRRPTSEGTLVDVAELRALKH